MGWGLAAAAAINYLSAKQQANAAQQASQPLPTYYQEYQSPQQQQMYGYLQPYMQNMYSGQMPIPTQAQMGGVPSYSPVATGQVPMPTAGWYSNLDPNVRAGIEEPYMRGMDMMRNQLGGGGMLGNQRAGMSGAAADVFGQYMQQAAPAMAQTGWNMMQPGLLAQQQQQYGAGLQAQGLGAQASMQQLAAQNQAALMGQQQSWEAQMFPYQAGISMLPTTYSDLLVGHTPTIQQLQPGAPMPPGYEQGMTDLQTQLQWQHGILNSYEYNPSSVYDRYNQPTGGV